MKLIRAAYDSAQIDPERSLQLAMSGLKFSEEKNFIMGMEKGMRTIGYAYSVMGDNKNAFQYFTKSLAISRSHNHIKDEAQTLFHIGAMYTSMGVADKAFEYQTQALKIYAELKDSLMMADTYGALAINLINQNLFGEADKYLLKATELYHRLKDVRSEAVYYGYLGINYTEQKKYEKAYACFMQSLAIEKTPETYSNLGDYFHDIGKPDSSIYYFKIALQAFETINNQRDIAKMHNNIGSILITKNEIKNAEEHLTKALLIAKQISDLDLTAHVTADLARLYVQKQDYKSAYEYYVMATKAKDSFSNTVTQAKIAELNTRYEVSELEEKNVTLRNENDIQKLKLERKNILIYGSLLAFIASVIIALLLVRQNRLKTNQQKAELEQKQLRAQMNPHFIFNCLNSIQHFVLTNDVKNANKYLSGFASLMRQTLENSKEGTITLQKEIAYLENYIALERMRFEDKFTYHLSCAPDVDPDSVEIPAMIIQPFIENSIRHGLCYLTDRTGTLTVNFYKKDGNLYCEIDDNGIGREQSQKLKSVTGSTYESHGIALTRQRMELVSKQDGADYRIEIRDNKNKQQEPTGTTVIIKFPISS